MSTRQAEVAELQQQLNAIRADAQQERQDHQSALQAESAARQLAETTFAELQAQVSGVQHELAEVTKELEEWKELFSEQVRFCCIAVPLKGLFQSASLSAACVVCSAPTHSCK